MNLLRILKTFFNPKSPELRRLEKRIKYTFNHRYYLEKSITHCSVQILSEGNYERLEFLGDAVIDQVVSHWLFNKYTQSDEGALTKKRASMVNRDFLAMVGKNLGVLDVLRIDPGVNLNDQKVASNITADVYEAIVGAVFLDGGFKQAARFITQTLCLSEHLADENQNYKGQLIEYCHKLNLPPPIFTVIDAHGPEHEKTFTIKVKIDGKKHWVGVGSTKKSAEQNGANRAIKFLSPLRS